jgi:DNA-directed RNA polymerase beta' subunit
VKKRGKKPLLLTPTVHKHIVEAAAKGVPRRFFADLAGCTQRNVRLWLARGKKEKKGVYSSLYSAVKRAEASAVLDRVARIEAAAIGGFVTERTVITQNDGATRETEKMAKPEWTADAWMLERRYPEEFALQRKKDIEEAVRKELEKALGNARK